MTDTDRPDTRPDDGAATASPVGVRDVGPGWPPTPPRHDAQTAGPDGPGKPPGRRSGGLRLALLAAFFVAVGARFGWSALVIIAGLLVMIFLHELGHYVTARWSGMKVTEFFIGFGPKIWSFRRGETEYGLKVVPLGAYVRIIGMNNLDEVAPADEPRTYRRQSFPRRLLVVSAGSLMHFAQAFVLIVVLLGLIGLPGGSIVPDRDVRPEAWRIAAVTEGSAAERAGLQDDDRILAVDGRPASTYDDFRLFISDHDVGDEIVLDVVRDGDRRAVEVELGRRPASVGGEAGGPFLGVATSPVLDDSPIGLGTALARTPGEMVAFTGEIFKGLGQLVSPSGIGDIADSVRSARPGGDEGPAATSERRDEGRPISIVGIVNLGQQTIADGAAAFLFFFVMINMFIGIFNLMPLPPLDGGHAVVAIYERLRSRRGTRYHADIAKLLPVTYAVVMGLVLLSLSALYLDIVNPINL